MRYQLNLVGLTDRQQVGRASRNPRTISIKRLSKRALADEAARVAAALAADSYQPEPRPRTYGECQERGLGTAALPCAYVSCKYNLALDVSPTSGAIKINRLDAIDPENGTLDVRALPETCALRVADRGGAHLIEIGDLLGLCRERIRQVEAKGLAALGELARLAQLQDYLDDDRDPLHRPAGQIDVSEV